MLIIYQPDGIFAFLMRFNHHIYAGFMRSYLNFNQRDIKQKLVTGLDLVPIALHLSAEAVPCPHPVSFTSLAFFYGCLLPMIQYRPFPLHGWKVTSSPWPTTPDI